MRIIPDESNKKLKREYQLRFFTLLFIFMSISIFVTIALVSSTYFLLFLYEKIYKENNIFINTEAVELHESIHKKTEDLYLLSKKISYEHVDPSSLKHIQKVFEYAGDTIVIQSLEVSQGFKITLRASAISRDSLLEFEQKMKSEFDNFIIPIETLAKQKDINFGVTFTYHEN